MKNQTKSIYVYLATNNQYHHLHSRRQHSIFSDKKSLTAKTQKKKQIELI